MVTGGVGRRILGLRGVLFGYESVLERTGGSNSFFRGHSVVLALMFLHFVNRGCRGNITTLQRQLVGRSLSPSGRRVVGTFFSSTAFTSNAFSLPMRTH